MTPVACANCDTTRGPIRYLDTDDRLWLPFCDDCAEAERAMEAKAYQLRDLPSCEVRQALIDQSGGTACHLMNVLTAHDQRCGCIGWAQFFKAGENGREDHCPWPAGADENAVPYWRWFGDEY